MIIHEIPNKVLALLKTKFNIIKHVSFLEFDYNFDILKNNLLSIRKDVYGIEDRILVEHLDTDFYYAESAVGINLRNFFTVADTLNIPLNLFVFYTNHFGIQKEIDIICCKEHITNRPLVLESFISKLHYPEHPYSEIPTNADLISCPALCMLHGKRSYRHALYNHISHLDSTQLAINYTTVL